MVNVSGPRDSGSLSTSTSPRAAALGKPSSVRHPHSPPPAAASALVHPPPPIEIRLHPHAVGGSQRNEKPPSVSSAERRLTCRQPPENLYFGWGRRGQAALIADSRRQVFEPVQIALPIHRAPRRIQGWPVHRASERRVGLRRVPTDKQEPIRDGDSQLVPVANANA